MGTTGDVLSGKGDTVTAHVNPEWRWIACHIVCAVTVTVWPLYRQNVEGTRWRAIKIDLLTVYLTVLMVTYGYRSNVKNFSPPSEHRTWWNDLRLLVYHSQHKTTPTGSLQQCVHGHTHHNAFLNYKSTSWFRYSTVGAKCPLILWASCSVVTLLNVSNKNAIGFLSISMRWRAISVYTAQVAMPLSNLHPMQACKSRLTKKMHGGKFWCASFRTNFFPISMA